MTQLSKAIEDKLSALRERYSPQPVPKCHICGAEMTVQRMSASRITYGCTGATYDDTGCHYDVGRSFADDHYEQSRVTVVDVSDPDVLALLDELEAEKRVSSTWRKTAESNREKLEAAEKRVVELRQNSEIDPRTHEIIDLKERIAELEEIATDYGMKFQRAQDDLKKMALMHRDEFRTLTVKLPDDGMDDCYDLWGARTLS